VRSIVEGAIIGDFDPGYYKSDRKEKDKEQKIDALTIVTSGDAKSLEAAMQAGRIVAESQTSPRSGQRTIESDDAEHPGRARQEMAPKSA